MGVPRLFIVAAVALLTAQDAEGLKAKVSPVRRVINMLTAMQKKCEDQVGKEAKLFDKYMCSCKVNKDNLMKSISEAQDKIPQMESTVQETKGRKDQLEADITQHKSDRDTATNAIEQAQAMRNRDKTAYDEDSAEMTTNVEALGNAIAALERGLSESGGAAAFLQTGVGQALNRLASSDKLPVALLSQHDRGALDGFLQAAANAGDSGEIVGILKQMRHDMAEDLQSMTQQETDAVSSFEALQLAKKREIAVASAAIEDKQGRHGEMAVLYVEQQHDLHDTREGLATDQSLLQKYTEECDKREKDYAILKRTMAEEQVALADTVKMLNDEDSQRLFAKTLPGSAAASFLQVNAVNQRDALASQAVQVAQRAAARFPGQRGLGLLANRAAATARRRSSSPGFAKIIELIDKMITLLAKNQEDDDLKKNMCAEELEKEADHKAALEEEIKAKTSAMENAKDQIDTVATEIQSLKDAIAELDLSVSHATEQRKEENADYLELLAGNNAAVELLHMAENRLNKFYNPDLYKASTGFLQDAPQQQQQQQQVLLQQPQQQQEQALPAIQDLNIQGLQIQAPDEFSPQASSSSSVDVSGLPLAFVQLSSDGGAGDDFGMFDLGAPEQPAAAPEQQQALLQEQQAPLPVQPEQPEQQAMPDQVGGVQIQSLDIQGVEIQAPAVAQDAVLAPPPVQAPPVQDAAVFAQTSSGDSAADANQGQGQAVAQDEFGFFANGNQYAKQSDAGGSVIRLIQMIQVDLQHEIIEAKAEESHAQSDYEELMSVSQTKRQMDARAITEKEGVHAELKESMNKVSDQKDDLTKEKFETEQVIFNLHKDCDWLMQNFEVRKTARAEEVESLQKAMSVLHGADISLAQGRGKR